MHNGKGFRILDLFQNNFFPIKCKFPKPCYRILECSGNFCWNIPEKIIMKYELQCQPLFIKFMSQKHFLLSISSLQNFWVPFYSTEKIWFPFPYPMLYMENLPCMKSQPVSVDTISTKVIYI